MSERFGHRICTRCGDLMQLTVRDPKEARTPDGRLGWVWRCRGCDHAIEAPTHPGRPQPFPEREDKQGG